MVRNLNGIRNLILEATEVGRNEEGDFTVTNGRWTFWFTTDVDDALDGLLTRLADE